MSQVQDRPKEKPKVVRKIPVRRTRDGIAGGDNSNSQYAALGLRACAEAGILIPKEVFTQARLPAFIPAVRLNYICLGIRSVDN